MANSLNVGSHMISPRASFQRPHLPWSWRKSPSNRILLQNQMRSSRPERKTKACTKLDHSQTGRYKGNCDLGVVKI